MTLSELQQFDEVTLSANSPSELFEYLNSETGERFLVNARTRQWCRLEPDGRPGQWAALEPEPGSVKGPA